MPSRLCVADITFVPTADGFLYFAVALDGWSRKIVGWLTTKQLRAELAIDALDMAIDQRQSGGGIHHSDHSTQKGLT